MKQGLARYLASCLAWCLPAWRVLHSLFVRFEQYRKTRWSIAALLSLCVLLDIVFPPPVPNAAVSQSLVILARDGTLLRAFPDAEHVWRHPVQLSEVSPLYIQSLLQYEDRAFYWHWGVNPFSLIRAGWQWARNGEIVSGGSTLTMQVARILEPSGHSLLGKLRQIARAVQLECHYSKADILGFYLNYAPMGGVLEGVEAASRAYLGKPSHRLTHADAALLTVMPQAPSNYRPDRHPEQARRARDKVLQRMQGIWSAQDIRDALQESAYAPLVREPMLAPLLAQRLKKNAELNSSHSDHAADGANLQRKGRLRTTIDAEVQQTVESLLLDRIGALPSKVSMAAMVVDNRTLEVRAYAGSADFHDKQRFSDVDMVRASRSPGSTLKPFLYGLALDEGLIHSESLLADVPQSFSGYQPGNFQQSFHGAVSVSEALGKSLNVPAVETLDHLGPNRFVALLRRGGLKLDFPRGAEPNLSVILGGAGTSLEQLVSAYTAFARHGIAGRPRFFADDKIIEQRMMSEGAAFIVRDILESGGPMGRVAENSVAVNRGIAWKTGTSFGFRDAWSIGVSDRFTVGVWIGKPDGTPNPGFFGANIAAPLLVDIFSALDSEADGRSSLARVPPANVTQEKICWPLGTRLRTDAPQEASLCHQLRTAWVLNGATPPTFNDRLNSANLRYTVEVDNLSGQRVLSDCSDTPSHQQELARWPSALLPWLEEGYRRQSQAPTWKKSCAQHAQPEPGLKLVGLNNGDVLHRARDDVPPVIRLDVRGYSKEVIWLINGQAIARRPTRQGLIRRLEEYGRYDITVLDDYGNFDRLSISVR